MGVLVVKRGDFKLKVSVVLQEVFNSILFHLYPTHLYSRTINLPTRQATSQTKLETIILALSSISD